MHIEKSGKGSTRAVGESLIEVKETRVGVMVLGETLTSDF